jgi:tartrate/fumarate subfamily iron-sulfur-dependent hydro-lyase beta chain
MIHLTTPISEQEILNLHVGDAVQLSGVATTGRDAAHKYMVEKLIEGPRPLPPEDQKLYDELQSFLQGGAIYHSGPIVRNDDGRWSIVSSGPTTSIRDEIYQDKVIATFGLRVVIGKGGMGPRTLEACKRHKAVFLHGIGGAGVYNAASVVEVLDVFKKEEFGLPEAFWKIRFDHFTGIVTMDAHGRSLHDDLAKVFECNFARVINQ